MTTTIEELEAEVNDLRVQVLVLSLEKAQLAHIVNRIVDHQDSIIRILDEIRGVLGAWNHS